MTCTEIRCRKSTAQRRDRDGQVS